MQALRSRAGSGRCREGCGCKGGMDAAPRTSGSLPTCRLQASRWPPAVQRRMRVQRAVWRRGRGPLHQAAGPGHCCCRGSKQSGCPANRRAPWGDNSNSNVLTQENTSPAHTLHRVQHQSPVLCGRPAWSGGWACIAPGRAAAERQQSDGEAGRPAWGGGLAYGARGGSGAAAQWWRGRKGGQPGGRVKRLQPGLPQQRATRAPPTAFRREGEHALCRPAGR